MDKKEITAIVIPSINESTRHLLISYHRISCQSAENAVKIIHIANTKMTAPKINNSIFELFPNHDHSKITCWNIA